MKNSIKLLPLLAVFWGAPTVAADFVVTVNGIVCEFCSLGVRKKVSRLPFIDRSKYDDGVDVDPENQKVTIAVRDDAELDREALFEAIRSAGYNPIDVKALDEAGDADADLT